MRVFISQASRNAAHNLDDLSERWELRRESETYSFEVPRDIPVFKNAAEAQLFRAELFRIGENLKLEIKRCQRASERDVVVNQHNHIMYLQMQTKLQIRAFAEKGDRLHADAEKAIRWQQGCFAHLVRGGDAELSQNERETTIHFPKQNITVRIPISREESS